jgi:hypothetical protein
MELKYKVGDYIVGTDIFTGHVASGVIVKVNDCVPGARNGYYINKVESSGQNFFYPEEVRELTKLEKALR